MSVFRIEDLESRGWGLGFGVWGLRFEELGFGVQESEFRVHG